MRSGFSIIRNGDLLDYPYRESLQSLSLFVDEIVLALGDCSDSTSQSLNQLKPLLRCPLKIIESPWDPKNLKGGLELSRQTNIALENCQHEVCLYLQGDEVFHDDDAPLIQRDLEIFEKSEDLDSLAFSWVHFYGNYDTQVDSAKWYRREIRAIKRSRGLKSFGDAQGFRILEKNGNWKKSRAALSRGRVFHYGWVRPPNLMASKANDFDKLWHEGKSPFDRKSKNIFQDQFGIREFKGRHPSFMNKRIANSKGDYVSLHRFSKPEKSLSFFRLAISSFIEKTTDFRIGEFKNYLSLRKL